MTAQRDPYVKVYYSIVDDPKFETVYDDDAALATWLRLLIVADGTYPAPAPVPLSVRRRAFDMLVGAGIVDVCVGSRYRIHGLEGEREKRSEAGRAGGIARANAQRTLSERSAASTTDAQAPHSDVSASPLHSAQLHSTPLNADAFETYQRLTGSWPSKRVTPWLSQIVDDFGEGRVCDEMVAVWGSDPDAKTFMSRIRDACAKVVHERVKEDEARDRQSELDYQRRMREEAETMPEGQRAANLTRLGDMLREKGLIGA
jgi:hypothetical protein